MTGTEGEIVYTQDISSGRAHKRIRTAAGLVPYGGEADNSDDAGGFRVITVDEMAGLESWALCKRCFGDPGPDPEDAA